MTPARQAGIVFCNSYQNDAGRRPPGGIEVKRRLHMTQLLLLQTIE